MMWLLEWLLEQLVQGSLKWLIDQAGPLWENVLFLIVGLSLLVGGPLCMSRENRRRKSAERKPRYGWLEYVIVVSGGLVFAAVGLARLVTAN
jgi:hypothetical protein